MKLIIKNLKQVVHEVEVKDNKITVKELKQEVEKVHSFDAINLKLLFNGVILEDTKTLEDYKINEESVLIMMNAKVKPKNAPVVQPNQEAKKEVKVEQKKEVKPKEPKQQEVKDYTKEVGSLVEMGFAKSEAEAAIKAAKGNVQLAIEFLYNGLPEEYPIPDEDDVEMNDVDEEENQSSEIKELAKIASIIKVICVQQPNALEGILASIEEQDPQLMELIKQNEDAFRTLLNQPVTNQDIKNFQDFQDNSQGGGYEERRNPPGTIELTKEEFEAVKRLREFGNFTDAEIVQAYFACDKNEELAVNLLFENKMNEDNGEINVNIVDDTNPQTNAQIQNPQLPTQLDMNQIGNLFSVLGQVLHGQSQQVQNQPQQPPKDDKKDEEKKDEGDKK